VTLRRSVDCENATTIIPMMNMSKIKFTIHQVRGIEKHFLNFEKLSLIILENILKRT